MVHCHGRGAGAARPQPATPSPRALWVVVRCCCLSSWRPYRSPGPEVLSHMSFLDQGKLCRTLLRVVAVTPTTRSQPLHLSDSGHLKISWAGEFGGTHNQFMNIKLLTGSRCSFDIELPSEDALVHQHQQPPACQMLSYILGPVKREKRDVAPVGLCYCLEELWQPEGLYFLLRCLPLPAGEAGPRNWQVTPNWLSGDLV